MSAETPLMMACLHGHSKIEKMLLDEVMDLNSCNKKGQPPILKAFLSGNTEIVKLFLDRGADCNICDKFNDSL